MVCRLQSALPGTDGAEVLELPQPCGFGTPNSHADAIGEGRSSTAFSCVCRFETPIGRHLCDDSMFVTDGDNSNMVWGHSDDGE